MRRVISGIAISPMGTLIQKIHCQATPSVTAPPITGPPSTATPVIALKIPSAQARRSGEEAAPSSASAVGITSAEPAPWTARAAISRPTLGASAHAGAHPQTG